MYFVYVLENAEGKFYVGQTEDLEIRLAKHNATPSTGREYALKHGPWRLVWSEEHSSRSSAMQREKQIKSMKSSRWIRENLLSRD